MEPCRETRHPLSSWLLGAGQGPAAAGLHSPPGLSPQSRCPADQPEERTCPYPHCPHSPGQRAHRTKPNGSVFQFSSQKNINSPVCPVYAVQNACGGVFFLPSILGRRVGFPLYFPRVCQQPSSAVHVRGNISPWDRSGIPDAGASGSSTFVPPEVLSPLCSFPSYKQRRVVCLCSASG